MIRTEFGGNLYRSRDKGAVWDVQKHRTSRIIENAKITICWALLPIATTSLIDCINARQCSRYIGAGRIRLWAGLYTCWDDGGSCGACYYWRRNRGCRKHWCCSRGDRRCGGGGNGCGWDDRLWIKDLCYGLRRYKSRKCRNDAKCGGSGKPSHDVRWRDRMTMQNEKCTGLKEKGKKIEGVKL